MPSTRSSAATKCISEVPGFVKQVSTPQATSVRTSDFGARHDRMPRRRSFPTPITAFISRNSSKPNSPHSRPLPDCL